MHKPIHNLGKYAHPKGGIPDAPETKGDRGDTAAQKRIDKTTGKK
jgi:hypothetical protein